MDIFHSMAGMVEVELTSADPGRALCQVSQSGIEIYEARSVGELTLKFRLLRSDYKQLANIAQKRGYSLRLMNRPGVYWAIKRLLSRPVLLLGLLFMIVMAVLLPSRIFFVQVEGNTSIPGRLILEKASECGICFGASRREVRSEKMKNALIASIPELQWAGVNTKGCTAVISVREKSQADEIRKEPVVSSIVARRDGIIVSCTAQQGNMLCRPGQAVRQGELLVSGYTDCGLSIRATRAIADIFGQTRRSLQAVTPGEYTYRVALGGTTKKYALIIGKKRINFYKDSGILGITCDKMSTVNNLTLPGGFQLPLALVTEHWGSYDCLTRPVPQDGAERILKDFAGASLKQQMIAGRILRQDISVVSLDGAYQLVGEYACLELIGVEQSGEILKNYG